jgi:anti-anti-sigma regulatory factor
MSVSLDQGDAQCLIHLESVVDINSAAELKKLLVIALQSGKEVRLDLERATELDVTALQLLWAANREAKRTEMGFSVVGRVPDAISAAVSDAGFEEFPVPLEQKAVETVQAL